ncbi:MAG: hypothetical protein QOJ29_92 [Thermoleophilaceae bacterium]|jgi:hypothetical protein|nr:hypothetical protein [Thermoleophilaceae bacterium]
MTQLPAPLIVLPSPDVPAGVTIVAGSELARAAGFAGTLVEHRRATGQWEGSLDIFAAADPRRLPPPLAADGLWVPHVFCWESTRQPALAWERSSHHEVATRFDADPADVARWAARPQALLDLLATAAGQAGTMSPGNQTRPGQPAADHLSFRWLLAHQELAAAVVSSLAVSLEHVSLHVPAEGEERVIDLLTRIVGLVEIPRPSSIDVPGRWLAAGPSRVHLNFREGRTSETGFPGPRPNHVCFAVVDVQRCQSLLNEAGIETKQAGSLTGQLWFTLPGGAVIELQPMASADLDS